MNPDRDSRRGPATPSRTTQAPKEKPRPKAPTQYTEAKPCAHCTEMFVGLSKKKYCSSTCLNAASYQRKKATK